jgi:hypothetical protein
MLLLTAACATAPREAATPAQTVVLRPAQIHEECRALKNAEQLRWQFAATDKVDFNIHYHVGNDVTYPVERVQVTDGAGDFAAPLAQEFCWMWTNRTQRDIALRIKFGP